MQMLDRGLNARLVQRRPSLIRPGSGTAPSLSAQMQAILAGTAGFVLDPFDASTKWQDDAGVMPWASPGDTVGRLATKYGTTLYFLTQASASSRPRGYANHLQGDGVDDFLDLASCAALQNVPFTTIGFRGRKIANSASTAPNYFSFNDRTRAIFPNSVTSFRAYSQRLDADGVTQTDVALGALSLDTDYTLVLQIDWAGTGAVTLRLNKSAYVGGGFPGAVGGSPANTSNTPTAFQLFARSNVNRLNGKLGRFFVAPKQLSVGEIDAMEAWLEELGAMT